jgi:ATP-dependent DNA helicase RecG
MARRIFISSVQSEFAAERIAVRDFIRGDTLLSRYFDVFIFEDVPAQSAGPQQVYLEEVDACSVYIGLFGEQYGYEDGEGVSPTEREFNLAVQKRKERLVFLKEGSKDARHSKMAALVKKAEAQLTRRSFFGIPDLNSLVKASLLLVLENEGLLHEKPFEARIADVKGKSIDKGLVDDFVDRAVAAGKLRLRRGSQPADVLRHLGILDDSGASNAAILLFSKEPARFMPGARVTCVHYSGAEPRRPLLSQKVYEGPLFEQIEQSIAFLSSHLDRRVGTRDDGGAVDTPLEIPVPAISEAIVNALVHRDYQSNAPAQVLLFVDRVEVRNPGELPRSLTPEQLRRVHSSIPRNARIADVLFRTNFVDRAGTGTLDMIAQCRDAGLAEPEFFQDGDQWVVRIWRDLWTSKTLQKQGLSERQIVGVLAARAVRRVTTQTYMDAAGTTRPTAKRDLEDLVQRGFLKATGAGRGAAYEFDHQWLKNGSNGSSAGDA